MAEVALTCNALNCHNKLCDEAVVTSCSHIFCKEHGQMFFKNGKVIGNCLVCGSNLSHQLDVYSANLNPSDKYKSIMLSGLNPEQILDIAGRAISFFTYQLSFESQMKDNYLKNLRRQQEDVKISLSTSFKAEILKLQRFADSLSSELEEKMKEIEAHKDKITQLVRENKQLQNKVEACRREMIFQRTTPGNNQDMFLGTPSGFDNYFMQMDNSYARKQSRSKDQLF